MWTYFWWILAIYNHCVAEADMEAALFVSIDKVHAYFYYEEIAGNGNYAYLHDKNCETT